MKILFWGTPAFAVPSLRALDDEGFDVVGVVTQPDRPAGRGRRLRPSPVKEVAEDLGLTVLTPERPWGEEFEATIRALEPDVSVVVAYGHILKQEILDVPALGSINAHASLLPELRGAAPIHWAIARGHAMTGVTVMRMVLAMDAGPVIHRVEEPILPDETGSELTVRLSELAAEALVEALALLTAGVAEEVEQDPSRATFAPKVTRELARIGWARPAPEVALHIRGMDAVPGAWSEVDGEAVKLFRPVVVEEADQGGPGEVVAADDDGLVVSCGSGAVRLGEVQPPGKVRMPSSEWIRGRGISRGSCFV
ncbi:MAG: methionyl-tRNA formyltransferase [Gemmatimonadota bacterium]|nr:methionyl-tRNA formyltransferase [Gemmatimonadota bacterium]